ncbi:MAG: asparagine synthase (glutamine-hydrolyzing) [Elusimicrobia bacterium]|nr:asparagine synthase (glutamine-hydrolyzing) [Elusimicrobiota bacterium]
MCGIAGQVDLAGGRADAAAVRRAGERLVHRGPDDSGEWSDGSAAFAFRRLSILDLEHGHQPMSSEDGRFTIVFNGEVYNHPALKEELEAAGARYRTRSDTETILRVFARGGADGLRRLDGMFALAVWDAHKRELTLARDPLGVKPLYYHFEGGRLSFASELRALLALLPRVGPDPTGLVDYLSYGFVHSPRTVVDSALKLPPGHRLVLNAHGLRVEPFWEVPARPPWQAHGRSADDRAPTLKEAEAEVERLLIAAVRGQLLSDVPVGAFLSGGLDSSLIAALMARASGGRVQTFSIGFSGARAGLDESAHARTVARWLGTDHHELVLPADVLSRLEDLAPALDEPVADSAILPTALLSRFARERVKVVLTGEGADELFAGYGRYKAAYLSERVSRLPGWGRGLAAAAARRMGKGPAFKGLPHAGLADWARASAHTAPAAAAPLFTREFLLRTERADPFEWLKDFEQPHSLNGALAFDLRTVLGDCLLMKADKATMAAGLEARVPYLDRRLVEYALHLPASSKIRRLKGKYLLRRIASKYLPRPIVWRRKHGFIVPWEEWVRAERNPALDALLEDEVWRPWGAFDAARLRALRDGARAHDPHADAGMLFRVAVLGLWLRGL